MKVRISATIDEETEEEIERVLKEGRYRNKSHIIEEAVRFFAEEKHGKNKK